MNQRVKEVEIQSEQRQQTIVISLTGSFDAMTADQVRSTIRRQFDEGQRQVVLDMSHVDFMSSSGVRVLLEMLKTGRGMGGDLHLAAAQPGVQRVLEISGLVRVIKVFASLEKAVGSFGPSEP
jgi:stage II sporulation protein AA (anti-sigma F factor antagonist)